MEKKIIKIKGMDCASCASVIEMGLKKTKGIISININYANEKAYVQFDPAIISLEKIKKLIKDSGYGAEEEMEGAGMGEMHDHHKMEKESEIKKLRNRFLFSLILSFPVIYMVMGGMIGLPQPSFFEKYGLYIQAVLSAGV
ncbi:MAG: cation transporter, partial [Lutibacter sp.]